MLRDKARDWPNSSVSRQSQARVRILDTYMRRGSIMMIILMMMMMMMIIIMVDNHNCFISLIAIARESAQIPAEPAPGSCLQSLCLQSQR